MTHTLFFHVQSLNEMYLYFNVTFISTLAPFEEDWFDFGDE